MKKTAMFTLAFMAIVSLVSAQRKQNSELSPMDRSKKSTEKMATMLGLDELQKNRIIEAKAYRISQIQTLNEKYQGPARKDHKEEYKTVMMKYKSEVKATLTPEQYTKWEAHINKKAQDRKEKFEKNKNNPKSKMDEVESEDFMIED